MDNISLLAVDDDLPILLLLPYRLGDGYEVMTARDVAEGLAMLAEHNPKVVLTDLNMPDGTGFQIIEACQERGILVALMTANVYEFPDRVTPHGAPVIAKPFEDGEPAATVQQLLNSSGPAPDTGPQPSGCG